MNPTHKQHLIVTAVAGPLAFESAVVTVHSAKAQIAQQRIGDLSRAEHVA
jgi:hypothetical protein